MPRMGGTRRYAPENSFKQVVSANSFLTWSIFLVSRTKYECFKVFLSFLVYIWCAWSCQLNSVCEVMQIDGLAFQFHAVLARVLNFWSVHVTHHFGESCNVRDFEWVLKMWGVYSVCADLTFAVCAHSCRLVDCIFSFMHFRFFF